jgi:hypothetical protein
MRMGVDKARHQYPATAVDHHTLLAARRIDLRRNRRDGLPVTSTSVGSLS